MCEQGRGQIFAVVRRSLTRSPAFIAGARVAEAHARRRVAGGRGAGRRDASLRGINGHADRRTASRHQWRRRRGSAAALALIPAGIEAMWMMKRRVADRAGPS